ncbi:TonB-dependent receptor [Pseudozobellia thermophila]|uniref:Outer membrane receptor proteins, mostly Fe transport n=1 Tax=Pseudozobellia thermophila TaxID=192903 RepID=A0A1M6C9K3_9FLAO|nr:TonB-dependent receptor [Pseudozobellia thermophila]SHI57685.1 Outer membrane receptor proteins, mostly Fe transport [Pseudozobellia thermophila]
MKKIIFAVMGLLTAIHSFAQTDISGSVTDSAGEPIPGANIFIVGSTSGTTSDFDGNFTFTTDLMGSQVLRASYLGFTTVEQTIDLNGSPLTVEFVMQEGGQQLDEVVLTASSTFRSQKQAPLSISSVKMKEITKLSANSQADILRSVPGITAEGGGGETASNIFVRGLPSGGQYVFNPLQYDGMPLISSFGLNSSAHDVYARPDIGFKGVEFVRGGAAVLYGAGSVAGIINYTSKTGDTNPGNVINLEVADQGRIKTDFYSGGQLGGEDSNTYYAFTGFVRHDRGPIDVGLPTKGVQFRGNIKKKFDKGSFTIHGQFINDNAQFYLPIPLSGGSRERINGNDGEPVEQLLTGALANTSFNTPGGMYQSPIADGVSTTGGYLLGDFNYRFNDDLKLQSKIRYANYKHNFALYVAGNGNNGNPISLDNYVESIAPANQGYTATYQSGSGAQINGSDLVIDNLHVDRLRPMTDYSGEINLTKTINTSNGGSHNITLGSFIARSEAEDVNYQYRVLTEFNNNPQLVNLSYVDADGNNVIYSQGGLYDRIGQTSNNFLSQNRVALYLTDEIIADKWRFDVGFRWEHTDGENSRGGIYSETVYTDADITAELSDVQSADGTFLRTKVSADAWALSLAGLYELTETTNLYANFSKGYFFPQLRGFTPVPGIDESKYDPENIIQFEAGAKFGNERFSGSIAGYYVGLTDRVSIRQAIVGGQLIDETRAEQNTRTIGLEATWDYTLVENLNLRGTATYQAHEITKNTNFDLVNGTSTEANVGNELARQPNFLGGLGLYYDNSVIDANFGVNHTGKKFTDDTNNIELDAINIGRLGAGYTFGELENNQSLRLGFSVFNLFDSSGITEGNPRAGVAGQSESEFFVGRPILPRRFFLTATFNF